MTADRPFIELHELVAPIADGCFLAIPKDESGVAMAATRALIRRGVKDLRLLCAPVCGLQADLLIGAGCVASVECGAITINEIGVGPRFRAAVQAGAIEVRDSTCPAIHAGIQAGEKGLPFVAIRGIIGSDLLAHRDDWRVVDNPLADGRGPRRGGARDQPGGVPVPRRLGRQIRQRLDRKPPRSCPDRSRLAYHPGDGGGDPRRRPARRRAHGAGTLSSTYVSAVSLAPRGAWPLEMTRRYRTDMAHLREYARLARSDEGFARYLGAHVLDTSVAA